MSVKFYILKKWHYQIVRIIAFYFTSSLLTHVKK